MLIHFLGTNGFHDSEAGNTVCTLIESERSWIILDAGSGFHRMNRYLYEKGASGHLFLSHFHLDHIIGLHMLNKVRFQDGLQILGPPGTEKILTYLLNTPFTVPMLQLPFHVTLRDLSEGQHSTPLSVECLNLLHGTPCYGFRFQIDGKCITYCTDTGICANAIQLAKNADLLITECSFKSGQQNPQWPHLNPELAVEIAKRAGAKNLALTHFDANIYPTIEERLEILDILEGTFPGLIIARDALTIEI